MKYIDDTPELGEYINPYPKNKMQNTNIKSDSKGSIIVLEGLDGSGKSSQAKMLYKRMSENGIKVFTTNFIHSDFIKPSLLKTKWENCDVNTFTCMYTMGLAYTYSKEIVEKLNEDYVVILDRYIYTIMVKAILGGANYEWVENLTKIFKKADITFFIDTPVETCLNRKKNDNKVLSYWECGGNIYENDNMRYEYLLEEYEEGFIKYQSAARKYFLEKSKKENWYVIDGCEKKEEINDKIYKIVIDFLNKDGRYE